MLFNSFQFIYFFIIIVTIYFAIPHKYRWMLLLGASYYFYMCWKLEYIVLILLSTGIDYIAGIKIGGSDAFVLLSSIPHDLNILDGLTLSLMREGFIIALLSIALILGVQMIQRKQKMRHFLDDKPILLRWSLYVLILTFIVLFSVDNGSQFIYFQF